MSAHDTNANGEFDLIKRYFSRHQTALDLSQPIADQLNPLILGVGDDCALLAAPPNHQAIAVTSDMLVADRHFFKDCDPKKLGHKALAVNLSDLAAMGAKPFAFTLSLALPQAIASNALWLTQFSSGLFALADQHHCKLIGGDTTAGPLNISITAMGAVNPKLSLRRSHARPDDDIWVSHEVGDARLALGHHRGEWRLSSEVFEKVSLRMDTPIPRLTLSQSLLGIAHAAIDISDGLLGDLRHILKASHLSAEIWIDEVPVSNALQESSVELRRLCALAGGDDYELCFTAPASKRAEIERIASDLQLRTTRIGKTVTPINNAGELRLLDENHQSLDEQLSARYLRSFDHFK